MLAACTLGLLVAPAAQAAKPSAIAFGAQPAPGDSEVILGEIDPGGEHTEFLVAYGLASSQWCTEQPDVDVPGLELSLRAGPLGLLAWIGGLAGVGSPFHAAHAAGLPRRARARRGGGGRRTRTRGRILRAPDRLQHLRRGHQRAGHVHAWAPRSSPAPATWPPTTRSGRKSTRTGKRPNTTCLYAPLASEWCTSSGAQGTPAELGALTQLGFTDNSFHEVSIELAGFLLGLEYCAALYALNEAGSSVGSQVSFHRQPPTVESLSPASGPASGGTTVTIGGTDLGGASAVHFGSAAATIESVAPGEVVVSAPAQAAGTVDVTVTTPAGTSEASKADLYTYEEQGPTGPTGPTGASGPTGSTGSTGSTGGNTGGGGAPALGQSEQVSVENQPVTAKLPGSNAFVALTGGATIPDGSEIDATHGSVVITVLTPDGKTVSAEVRGGRFRIHQDPNGETHLILTLALSGCPRTKLPHGSAAAASARRRHRPRSRYLWVTEKGGHWGTSGRYVSTSVEGTTWLTLDECSRSVVLVSEGRVRVRNLVTHRAKTVGAGGRYEARAKRPKHRGRH